MLRFALPAIRSDYKAAETYAYRSGPKLRCPVVALNGDVDERVGNEEMETWADHTSGGFEFHILPGGHFYLSEQKSAVVKIVADFLLT